MGHSLRILIDTEADAGFGGPDEQYRWWLTRVWNPKLPLAMFAMLNPSTGSHERDDPTLRKDQTYARLWGYGGIVVVNAFALRSTDPAMLKKVTDPVGPMNDHYVAQWAVRCALVVCAWGNHATYMNRDKRMMELLRGVGATPHALKLNKDGSPCHPLYLPLELRPEVMAV